MHTEKHNEKKEKKGFAFLIAKFIAYALIVLFVLFVLLCIAFF